MSTRCSANQIAEFVVLWGLAGTFPKYCKYVEQARELKSLDLIISTLDVFVDAFCFSFEDIYRKYEVDFPLSHEKFIEFLKPRCLLLTKDDKCFNFMLVCAFVSETINSFAHYNRCYHLAEVSSKCLTTILKNRFKRIFETHSGWEELLSFCRKIHSLVYPPEKKFKSDGDQSVGEVDKSTKKDYYGKEKDYSFPVTSKMDAVFSNLTEKFPKLSIEKNTADDSSEDSNAKMAYLSTDKEGEKLERSCKLDLPTSVGATHIFQLKDKDVREITEKKDEGKDCVTDASLSDLTKNITNMPIKTTVISNEKEDTEEWPFVIVEKKSRVRFGDCSSIKEVTKRKDLCTLGLASSNVPHTLRLKDEDSLPKEAAHKEKNARDDNEVGKTDTKDSSPRNSEQGFVMKMARKKKGEDYSPKVKSVDEEKKAREGDEKVCQTGIRDSSLPNFEQEVIKAVSDYSDENTVKLVLLKGTKKNLTLSFGTDSVKKITPEKFNFLNFESTSVCASRTLQLKGEDYSSKESVDGEKVCATSTIDSLLHNLEQEVVNAVRKENDENPLKFGQLKGIKKNLTLSFGTDSAKKKTPEKFNLLNFEPISSSASRTLQLKNEDYSSKEKSLDEEKNARAHENVCATGMRDSSLANLEQEVVKAFPDKKNDNPLKLGQLKGTKKNLTLSFGTDSVKKKTQEKFNLLNFEPTSASASQTLQLKGEDFSPKEESTEKLKTNDEKIASADNKKLCQTVAEDSYKIDEGPVKPGMRFAQNDQNLLLCLNTRLNQTKPGNIGQMIGFKKRSALSFGNDLATKEVLDNLNLFNIEPIPSEGAWNTLLLKGEDTPINEGSIFKENIVGESITMDSNEEDYPTDSLPSDLTHELDKMPVNDNMEGAEKSGHRNSQIKQLTLSLQNDSVVENTRKKSLDLYNLVTGSSTNALQFGDTESCSKDESEGNEPFDIHSMPADEIRSRITDNAHHLSEIMDLLKKCEEDIDPNLFPPDEYNILSYDAAEVLEASGGISESSSNHPNKLKLVSKTIVFAQNIKMVQSIKRIFRENNPSDDESDPIASGGEPSNEMSDDVAYVYGQRMLASKDPLCSQCAGKMTPFFDAWTDGFFQKYTNNCLVSDLFTVTDSRIEAEEDQCEKINFY